MAVGPDRLYYSGSSGVGAVTYQGVLQTGIATSDGGTPEGMTEGVTGAIYYSESTGHLGELQPLGSASGALEGTMTSWNDFGVGTVGTNSVTSDPNGNLWFTERNNGSVVEMSPWGSLLNRVTLTASGTPWHAAVGADQASIWVTERAASKIAKITLAGVATEYPLPGGCGSDPNDIALGSDGNMYFTQDPDTGGTGYLGQITPSGTITCFATPNSGDTTGIVEGPDGNMWIAEYTSSHIVKFNISSETFGTPLAVTAGQPQVMTLGADGEIWFITPGAHMVSFQPN